MHTITIDKTKLMRFHNAAQGSVKYNLGSKPKIGTMPVTGFRFSDCSGYVRWLIAAATTNEIIPPDGSWYQQKWCKEQGLKLTDYHAVAGLGDNRLRIAFINSGKNKVGHVWLVLNGQTLECCGRKGVCRRPWNTAVLKNEVDACYVLTNPLV
jgi:hypothetical protein